MTSETPAQTFLFADLAGYTALTEAHGDDLAADTAAAFVSAARELLAEAVAEEVKSLGDGVMLRVPDAMDAVRLGARLVTDTAGHRSLGVRVGMHTGPAVERGDDWFGATVNIAARVAELARAGEVLLTDATRNAAGPRMGAVVLDRRGAAHLRHVPRPVELFSVYVEDPRFLVDPVCHMALDPALAAAAHSHDGIVYRFCSQACADAFQRDPARYLS
jgi:adenylate cyclase